MLEQQIVNGLMLARPGAKVTPQEQGTPPQASASPAKID